LHENVSSDPDELLPADSFWTTGRDTAVKLRVEANGPQSEKPVTVMTAFRQTVEKAPNHPAMGQSYSEHNSCELRSRDNQFICTKL